MQKAEAELAYELQAAKTKQRIKEENMEIKVKELNKTLLIKELNKTSLIKELNKTLLIKELYKTSLIDVYISNIIVNTGLDMFGVLGGDYGGQFLIPGPSVVVHSYSVMQSDGNSFCRDVVFDSFNKSYWDEDNSL